ncbi:pyridoxal 5'-phosphate synthase glutaminase subunit PdxT [Brachybacterium sp. EF45031]|nr:pyridoxal 5'-phosphate synthase glutaminase subunit PdxT [Brachybacterium sillae]
MLRALGQDPVLVRRAADLDGLEALVLPGGESSTIDRLTRVLGLRGPLQQAIADGLPVLGTCAGMILVADRVLDPAPGQQTLGGLDVTVRRNAFGRQVDSTEEPIDTPDGQRTVAYIRAPKVEDVGEGVEVIATRPDAAHRGGGSIVGVRTPRAAGTTGEGPDIVALAFHPELTGVTDWHEDLLDRVRRRRAAG